MYSASLRHDLRKLRRVEAWMEVMYTGWGHIKSRKTAFRNLQRAPPMSPDLNRPADIEKLRQGMYSLAVLQYKDGPDKPSDDQIALDIEKHWLHIWPWMTMFIEKVILPGTPNNADPRMRPQLSQFIEDLLGILPQVLMQSYDCISFTRLVKMTPDFFSTWGQLLVFTANTMHYRFDNVIGLLNSIVSTTPDDFVTGPSIHFTCWQEDSANVLSRALINRLVYELCLEEIDLQVIKSLFLMISNPFPDKKEKERFRLSKFSCALRAHNSVRWSCYTLSRLTLKKPPFPVHQKTLAMEAIATCIAYLYSCFMDGLVWVVQALDCHVLEYVARLPYRFIDTATRRGLGPLNCCNLLTDAISRYIIFPSVRRRVDTVIEKVYSRGMFQDCHTNPDLQFWFALQLEVYHALSFEEKRNENNKDVGTSNCSNPECSVRGNRNDPETTFGYCSGCRLTWYCSQRCQKAHWRTGHRILCLPSQHTAVKHIVPTLESKAVLPVLDYPFIRDYLPSYIQRKENVENEENIKDYIKEKKLDERALNKTILLVDIDFREHFPADITVHRAMDYMDIDRLSRVREYREICELMKVVTPRKEVIIYATLSGRIEATVITKGDCVY